MKNKLHIFFMAVTLVIMPTISFGQSAPDLGAASGFALFNAGGAFDSNGATLVTGNIGSFTVTPTITSPGVVTGSI